MVYKIRLVLTITSPGNKSLRNFQISVGRHLGFNEKVLVNKIAYIIVSKQIKKY